MLIEAETRIHADAPTASNDGADTQAVGLRLFERGLSAEPFLQRNIEHAYNRTRSEHEEAGGDDPRDQDRHADDADADGTLRSRPMATQDVEFEGTLWFFTSAGSAKMSEIRQYPQVSVSYASADDHRYVSLSGRASLIQDAEKMKELWSPVYRAWFPQGLDDPELCSCASTSTRRSTGTCSPRRWSSCSDKSQTKTAREPGRRRRRPRAGGLTMTGLP